MKRLFLWLLLSVAILAIGAFGGYQLWQASTGKLEPLSEKVIKRHAVISVPYSPLTTAGLGPVSAEWNRIPQTERALFPQVLMVPWGKEKKKLLVRAVHDEKKIAFQVSWPDATKNDRMLEKVAYPDATAIMFPLKHVRPSSIMMGFLEPVNIWHWKAARKHTPNLPHTDYTTPLEKGTLLAKHRADVAPSKQGSEIIDFMAVMPASLTEKVEQSVNGSAQWVNGKWYATFSRDLTSASEEDSQFDLHGENWAGFALWDGEKKERGPRKSISDWVRLDFGEKSAVR